MIEVKTVFGKLTLVTLVKQISMSMRIRKGIHNFKSISRTCLLCNHDRCLVQWK